MPNPRRAQLPNATPTHVIEQLLTLPCSSRPWRPPPADRLADAAAAAASTAQKYLPLPAHPPPASARPP